MDPLTFGISIDKPCTELWGAMSLREGHRHCKSCQSTVYNLDTLTIRQIEALFLANGGEICGRIRTFPDKSIAYRKTASHPRQAALVVISALSGMSGVAVAQMPVAAIEKVAPGQLPQQTKITGIITDGTGALIVGARITVLQGLVEVTQTTTSRSGEYVLTLPAGNYVLSVNAAGFSAKSLPIELALQDSMENVALTAGTNEEITVTSMQADSFTTMGAMISTIGYGPWYKRIGMRMRHPIAYTRYALRHKQVC